MKTKKIVSLLAFSFISIAALYAQQGQFYQFSLDKETKIRGSKIYIQEFANKGAESQIDVNALVKSYTSSYFATYIGVAAKKIQNHISWTCNPRFEAVNSQVEADVTIGGYYQIKTSASVGEKLFYERGNSVGGAIPYFETRQLNSAEVMVLISYTYKDNAVDYDTIFIQKESERTPGKKFLSVEELLVDCESNLKRDFYHIFPFYSHENVWYKLLNVKTKDKALKEELKAAKEMFESGKIKELGNIYLRIFQAEPENKEAAFNVAMCYELIGNYPKADEYYAIMPDFHAKVRMKTNRILFDYLNSIGANLVLEDF
ncbi:MAG: hypothetical protein RBS07_08915 [Lentimicrobium sp.]|jgi:hypothetical protein|nr:hypothetical protein [Lentimicrobium sp.]